MSIIKFDTICSTSDFLKELSKNKTLTNFTTVVADEQTHGRGQMNAKWNSMSGKNLLFTVYADLKGLSLNLMPYINFLVSTVLYQTLCGFISKKHRLKIKWPNDIMSYSSKMAGILVENSVCDQAIEKTFIGIGLNVNQIDFSDLDNKATSMQMMEGGVFDRDEVLHFILEELKKVLSVNYIKSNQDLIQKEYLEKLYKLEIPSMFKDKMGHVFLGKIIGVSIQGCLQIEKDEGGVTDYDVKEIKFL